MSATCNDFSRGMCHRGSACRYTHGDAPASSFYGSGGGGGDDSMTCKDFQRGSCTRGAGCKYSHVGGPVGGAQMVAPPPPAMWGGYDAAYQAMYPYMQAQWAASMPQAQAQHAAAMSFGGVMPGAPPGGQTCRDFARGQCARGQACRFPHTPLGGGMMGGAPVMGMYPGMFAGGMPGMEGPPLCRDFQDGRCERGLSCKYMHQLEVCRDFVLGKCDRENCKYHHQTNEGARCRDYSAGHCARDNCRFLHQNEADIPCRDFLKGSCSRDNCKYKHASDAKRAAPSHEEESSSKKRRVGEESNEQ